jgi:fido (protein-threonine AMPylation protein)
MVRGAELEEKPTVVLYPLPSSDQVLVYDGADQVKASICLNGNFEDQRPTKVQIRSYVVSEANAGLDDPFLCITAVDVLEIQSKGSRIVLPEAGHLVPQQGAVQGGKSPHFMSTWVPFLDNEALAGSQRRGPVVPNNSAALDEKLTVVLDFLRRHHAMKTLHRSASNASSSSATDKGTTETYMKAMEDFKISQMDRQKATLQSTAGRENRERAQQIVKQHQEALEMALQEADSSLSMETLCKWHERLCGNGLLPAADAGRLRRKTVRVGSTNFAPSHGLSKDVTEFCRALYSLQSRLLLPAPDSNKNLITFAAATLFGILDVHPFADGNGRLSRIGLNYALRKAGFPFVIHLFANAAQRAEYVTAIRITRRNISLAGRGDVTQDMLLDAFQRAGVLVALVELLVDRLHRAVTEFNKLLQEASAAAEEQAAGKAARAFRERAASGTCFICFDDNPNIATLCCGKAVHLNCMAEWLSSKNSCPQCRAGLPPLPERMRPQAPANSDATDEEEEVNAVPQALRDHPDVDTTEYDTTEESTTEVAAPAFSVNDTTTTDFDTTTYVHTELDGTMDDGTTTDVAPVQWQSQQQNPFCSFVSCNNRLARDCANYACGRCCVAYGRYQCERHAG